MRPRAVSIHMFASLHGQRHQLFGSVSHSLLTIDQLVAEVPAQNGLLVKCLLERRNVRVAHPVDVVADHFTNLAGWYHIRASVRRLPGAPEPNSRR